jgi:cell division protein FtsB
MKLSNFTSISISKKQIVNSIIILLLAYFIFHSIYGSRGILAYFKLQADLQKSHETLVLLRDKRLDIENRTKLLRPESLDLDMLDEKARNVLGLSDPKEKVFKNKIIPSP